MYLVYSSEQWTMAVLIIQCHAADAIIVARERQERGCLLSTLLIPLVRVSVLVGSNGGTLH